VRTIQEGEHAILKNRHNKYAVLKVLDVKDRTRSDAVDELTFEYRILTDNTKAEHRADGGKRRAGPEIRERAEEVKPKRGTDKEAVRQTEQAARWEATREYPRPSEEERHKGKAAVLQKTPKPVIGFRDIAAPWCPELVFITLGEFLMGSTEPERRWAIGQGAQREFVEWEKPQHRVVISELFAAGQHPVTRGQFATFVEATGHDMGGGCWVFTGDEWEHSLAADWCAPGFEQTDDHPVVGVSWQDATAYVEWLGRETGQPYRLLSEGEWEYACRAGTTTRYSWGDDPPTPKQANFGMEVCATTAVGTYQPNSFGLYDMHGNVLEWCQDCWNQGYAGGPRDGSAWTTGTCGRRMLRGGSWYDMPALLRSANRSGFDAGTRNANVGFRVARTVSRSEGRMRALNFLGSGAEPRQTPRNLGRPAGSPKQRA
jgi:formylglycine-generating enzyme required for sulfatase activity